MRHMLSDLFRLIVLCAVTSAPSPACGNAHADDSMPAGTRESLQAAPAGASSNRLGGAAVGRCYDFGKGWQVALVYPDGVTDPTGAYASAADPGYDDTEWRSVTVPHERSIELAPTNAPGAVTDAASGFYQGGLGWYRKSFTLAAALAGKVISLEFDGVHMDPAVYLNGHLLARHAYGYTGFSVDLAPHAQVDGQTPNVLAVEVRNEVRRPIPLHVEARESAE